MFSNKFECNLDTNEECKSLIAISPRTMYLITPIIDHIQGNKYKYTKDN